MSNNSDISQEAVDLLYKRLDKEAEQSGYHLNPDVTFTRDLVRGLIINEKRYGYWACPCRLASGDKSDDLDIICPCDYRDADLNEYDACYCGLYVSRKILDGQKQVKPIPERRPPEDIRKRSADAAKPSAPSAAAIPIWRCKVCGYLCARNEPPEVCPVCKAKRERFERFM